MSSKSRPKLSANHSAVLEDSRKLTICYILLYCIYLWKQVVNCNSQFTLRRLCRSDTTFRPLAYFCTGSVVHPLPPVPISLFLFCFHPSLSLILISNDYCYLFINYSTCSHQCCTTGLHTAPMASLPRQHIRLFLYFYPLYSVSLFYSFLLTSYLVYTCLLVCVPYGSTSHDH